MKVTLGARPDIKCPNCQTKPTLKTGFWGAFLASAFLNKLEDEGGVVTCPQCRTRYKVQGSKHKRSPHKTGRN